MSQLDVEKELGDLLWYISRLADEYGIPLSSIASVNLSKLLERYPQGFSSADSIKRVDVNG